MPSALAHTIRAVTRRCAFAFAALALLTVPPVAVAQSPLFTLRQWTTADGLPAHSVNGVVQGPRGFLWLATSAGLVRFDGQQFTVVGADDGVNAFRVMSVYVDRAGRVLASVNDGRAKSGLDNGRVLASDGGSFTEIARGYAVNAFGEDAQGRLWAGVHRPTAWLTPDGTWSGGPPPDPAHPTDQFVRFGTVTAEFMSRVPQPSTGRMFSIHRDARPRVLVVDRGDGGRWIVPTSPQLQLHLVDRGGRLWVSGDGAMRAFLPNLREPVARLGLPTGAKVTAMAESADGLLWFGTETAGLFRIQQSVARVFGKPEGAADDQIRNILVHRNGRVSMSDASGVTMMLSPDGTRLVRDPGPGFWFVDDDGPEWRLLSTAGNGVVGDGVRTYALPGPLPPQPRVVTAPNNPRIIWMTGSTYVARFAPDENSRAPFVEVHHGLARVADVLVRANGDVMVLSRGGLLRIHDGTIETIVPGNWMPPGELRALLESADGTLWFTSYGGGLSRVRGSELKTLTARDGLTEDAVASLAEDNFGSLWLGGNRGITRLDVAEANAFLDGLTPRVYPVALTRVNELRNPETSGWPARKAPDGRLWFPTFGGAVVVDPRVAHDADMSPPRVWIDQVIANGRRLTGSALSIPPGNRRVEFRYTGISLPAAEQVRYQYRIDGVDRDWLDAGTSRTATYSSLPPGTRTFRVRATRGTGQWSSPDTTAVIVVAPFAWETGWFRTVAVLAMIGLALGFARYRVINLRRRAEHLQRLVDARTSELRAEQQVVTAQAAELDELNRAKSRFFANISHEFRTPLTLIQGPLDDLLAGAHGRLSEAAHGLLRLSVSNTRRVLQLVDQMLDLAKADSGRLCLQAREVDLRGFVLTMCEAFDATAAHSGLAFRVVVPSGPLMAWVDPDQLEKILVNLVGNAIKYSESGGSVEVELLVDDRATPATVELRVRDTGDGIPEADVPRVFERYYRAAHSSARRAGTGIGLALAKELVELHRGTISLESVVGTGSVFTVRLPLGRAHLADEDIAATSETAESVAAAVPVMAEVAPKSARASDAMTLVVVDDSADIREYLRTSLAGRFEVLEAEDGATALALVSERVPDLVVSDVMMPVMDGFELCRAIKGNPETEFTPVILLTARASADSRVEGLGVGADDYLVKPFNMRELTARIDNLIASRKRWRAQLNAVSTPTGVSDNDEFIVRLRAAIEGRISEEGLVAETLATDLAMSRATFYRRVEQVMGQSPADLVWTVRLERAATLLGERAGTVAEIAYGLGFTSLSHFSRRFRDKFGMSPSAWRRGVSRP